jgi:hypothetical protein
MLLASVGMICSSCRTVAPAEERLQTALNNPYLFKTLVRENRLMHESADFWREIASNPTAACSVRQIAALQLFCRHVKPGMTMEDLAVLLAKPLWLDPKEVTFRRNFTGPGLLTATGDFEIVDIELFSSCSDHPFRRVSFSVQKSTADRIQLYNYLRGIDANPKVGSLTIREVVSYEVSADRLRWVHNGFGTEDFKPTWHGEED